MWHRCDTLLRRGGLPIHWPRGSQLPHLMQGMTPAGKPGNRTVKLLDVSAAIQHRHRPGAQHRRFPAASSPLHLSSPGHSRPLQSPAPHQAAGDGSSASLQAPRTPTPHHAGSAKQAPGGLGMSRLKGSGHAVGPHSQAPHSPAPHRTAGESSSPAQAATASSPQHASRSPAAALHMPTGPALSHLQGPGHAVSAQVAPPASANGSAAPAIMGREPLGDTPGQCPSSLQNPRVQGHVKAVTSPAALTCAAAPTLYVIRCHSS